MSKSENLISREESRAPLLFLFSDESSQRTEECGDCDCACAHTSNYSANQAHYQNNLVYKVNRTLRKKRLDSFHYVVWGETVKPFVINHESFRFLQNFGEERVLSDIFDKFDVLDEKRQSIFDKLVKYGILNYDLSVFHEHRQKTLTAWIHLTDNCNLSCSYCYLPHDSISMTEKNGYLIIDRLLEITRINGYSRLKLKYAGGEPILQFSLLEKLHNYLIEHAADIEVEGIVLSNGTMLSLDIIEKIIELDLRLMISLDGFSSDSRNYVNGKSSSDDIRTSIILAKRIGAVPIISVTVSMRNIKELPDLILWILKQDLPFSLNFYRENDLSKSHQDLELEDSSIIQGMIETYNVIEEYLPRRKLVDSLLDRTHLLTPNTTSCSAGKDYLVINIDGSVAKCHMNINEPIGNIREQNIFQQMRNSEVKLNNPSVDEKIECSSCTWRYWCGGGCPLLTKRINGNQYNKSPYCKIYKSLFPRLIQLEGLRLLRYSK